MTGPRYGTRWPRTVLVFGAALAVVAALLSAVGPAVLAGGVNAQASRLDASIGRLAVRDASFVVTPVPIKGSDREQRWVLRLGVGHGEVTGLCATQKATLLGQTVTLLLDFGDRTVQLTNAILDIEYAQADIRFQGNIQLNRRGDQITIPGTSISLAGRPDDLGLSAGGATLDHLLAGARDITIVQGTVSIPDLDVKIVRGDVTCPPPRR